MARTSSSALKNPAATLLENPLLLARIMSWLKMTKLLPSLPLQVLAARRRSLPSPLASQLLAQSLTAQMAGSVLLLRQPRARQRALLESPRLLELDKWVKATSDGKTENQRKTGRLFFSALPHSDEGLPSLDNRLGSPEMMEVAPGNYQLSPKFWREQIFQGGRAKKMELAGFTPTFLLSDEGKIEHSQALGVMSQDGGIGVGGERFKLALWSSRCWAFKNLMEAPLAKEARLRGFWPLFLLKQAINQKKAPGGARAHLSSAGKSGKPALALAGRWKGRSGPTGAPFSDAEFLSLSASGPCPAAACKGSASD